MGTTLTPVSSFDAVVCPNPGEVIRAGGGIGTKITIAGVTTDGELHYTGLVSGARVKHLGGASKTLAVTVVGNDVTVQLGTDAGSNVTSTATDVVNKILTVPAALALLSVTAGGTGLGTPTVVDWVKLGAGPVGSIRRSLQALLNRTQYLYDKIIFGLLSFKSLTIDTTGENVVTPTPGQGTADVWQTGTDLVEGGRFTTSAIKFRNVGALSNPTPATALKNELRPLNIVKCFGTITINMGSISNHDGASYVPSIVGNKIKITMLTPMFSAYYTVIPSIMRPTGESQKLTIMWERVSATEFYLIGQDNFVDISLATVTVTGPAAIRFCFVVYGSQF